MACQLWRNSATQLNRELRTQVSQRAQIRGVSAHGDGGTLSFQSTFIPTPSPPIPNLESYSHSNGILIGFPFPSGIPLLR